MTGRAIIALAVSATVFLTLGAQLLQAPTTPVLLLAIGSLLVGTALAAAAVAAAWRPATAASDDLDRPRR